MCLGASVGFHCGCALDVWCYKLPVGIGSQLDGIPTRTLLERVYVEGADEGKQIPTDGVPPLLKQVQPLHAHVKVDVYVPGCPPSADTILYAVSELLEGRVPDVGSRQRFG